jgi:hypothetical protein
MGPFNPGSRKTVGGMVQSHGTGAKAAGYPAPVAPGRDRSAFAEEKKGPDPGTQEPAPWRSVPSRLQARAGTKRPLGRKPNKSCDARDLGESRSKAAGAEITATPRKRSTIADKPAHEIPFQTMMIIRIVSPRRYPSKLHLSGLLLVIPPSAVA